MPSKSRTPTYRSWEAMKARCDNPQNNRYKYYGAKGISYPSAWFYFEGFLKDMGERPEGKTLERKESAQNYSKDNCIWADAITQNRNRGSFSNNVSGVKGVSWQASVSRWYASGKINHKTFNLYSGSDFFLAVCARKSWENRVNFSSKES